MKKKLIINLVILTIILPAVVLLFNAKGLEASAVSGNITLSDLTALRFRPNAKTLTLISVGLI